MSGRVSILEIINHIHKNDLHQFIIDYADKNTEFRQAFNAKFNSSKIGTGDKKAYADMVSASFANNPFTSGGRYRNWTDYGCSSSSYIQYIGFYFPHQSAGTEYSGI